MQVTVTTTDEQQSAAPEAAYVTPGVSDLGTVTKVTLGHAGGNNADDTQYYSNW
ncbi:hypothetical protein ACLB9X_32930 [Streptomyces sp. 5K101]|uniref:hypothetical protein n=1 Tax=Streptomyces sp. 5K101 TaxID=3390037 RepID=UPI00397524B6